MFNVFQLFALPTGKSLTRFERTALIWIKNEGIKENHPVEEVANHPYVQQLLNRMQERNTYINSTEDGEFCIQQYMTCLFDYPFLSDLKQAVNECYKEYRKMNKAARFRFINNSVKKIRMARTYVLQEKIVNSEVFDNNIPWPQDMYVNILTNSKCTFYKKSFSSWHVLYLLLIFLQDPWSWWHTSNWTSTDSTKERRTIWTDWCWNSWFTLPRFRLSGRSLFTFMYVLCVHVTCSVFWI